MNVIFILFDSLNKSYIEPYGNQQVDTKNMQKLADKGVVFENHFLCSAPCMPARRELFSGRINEFLWRFWGSMEPFDRPLPLEARKLGAVTALVTDHYHYWEQAGLVHGYHENYMYTDLIRGHEMDTANTEPLEDDVNYPGWVKSILKWRSSKTGALQYYRNVKHYKGEEDFHGPKVIQSACDWLDKNHSHEQFFLHIESFDPHEPFYVPEPYRSMYGPYNEDFTCWPPYQDRKTFTKFMKDASNEELDFIRNQYKGKVTMLDKWLGNLWDKMDQYNLWENTMVILTSDHGHSLAEPEKKIKQFAKGHPIFEDVGNLPLIIYHPEMEGKKRISSTFSTIVDLRATILHALGAEKDDSAMVDGKSLLPVLSGEEKSIRDYILYGIFGTGCHLTTWDTTYIRGFNSKKPLHWYSSSFSMFMSPSVISSLGEVLGVNIKYEVAENMVAQLAKQVDSGFFIPGVVFPQWKVPIPSAFLSAMVDSKGQKQNYLFNRKEDPNFQNNLADNEDYKELEQNMIQKMRDILKKEGCPPEQFERLMLMEK